MRFKDLKMDGREFFKCNVDNFKDLNFDDRTSKMFWVYSGRLKQVKISHFNYMRVHKILCVEMDAVVLPTEIPKMETGWELLPNLVGIRRSVDGKTYQSFVQTPSGGVVLIGIHSTIENSIIQRDKFVMFFAKTNPLNCVTTRKQSKCFNIFFRINVIHLRCILLHWIV